MSRVKSCLKLHNLRPRQRFGDGNILNDSRFIPLGLKRQEGHWLRTVKRQLLHKLDLKPIGSQPAAELSANADTALDSTVEKRNVQGEGDTVVVLAGDTVVVEEDVDAELSNALDSVAVEKVVEEEQVVFGEEEVTGFAHFVKRGKEPSL